MVICSLKTMFLKFFLLFYDKKRPHLRFKQSQDSLFYTWKHNFFNETETPFILLFGCRDSFLLFLKSADSYRVLVPKNIFLSLVAFHFCVVRWITCVSRCFVIQSMPEDGKARRSQRDHQLCVRKAFLLSLLSLRRLEEIAENFWKGWSRGKAQTSGEKCGKFVNCGKQIKARRRTTPATSEKSSTILPCHAMEKSSFIQMLMYQPLNLRLVSFILCRSDVVYWSSPMLS